MVRAEARAGRVVVVVPTYDEADNIRALAERVLAAAPGIELLVVDDNSPDGTGEIGDRIASEEPRFHIIHRLTNRGYAPSSREGMAWCLERGYDYVVTMDGDLSHDPARIPALLARAKEGYGLVVGSRYIEGGAIEAEWGPIRRAISQVGSRYARAMIRTSVHDCTSGYRCYSRETVARLRLHDQHSDGYAFLIEVLAEISAAGVKIDEVPITYTDRQNGASKISKLIVVEALFVATGLGMRRVLGGLHRS